MIYDISSLVGALKTAVFGISALSAARPSCCGNWKNNKNILLQHSFLALSRLSPPRNANSTSVCLTLRARITMYFGILRWCPGCLLVVIYVACVASWYGIKKICSVACISILYLFFRSRPPLVYISFSSHGSDSLHRDIAGRRTQYRCLLPRPAVGRGRVLACAVVSKAPSTGSFTFGS